MRCCPCRLRDNIDDMFEIMVADINWIYQPGYSLVSVSIAPSTRGPGDHGPDSGLQ